MRRAGGDLALWRRFSDRFPLFGDPAVVLVAGGKEGGELTDHEATGQTGQKRCLIEQCRKQTKGGPHERSTGQKEGGHWRSVGV